MSNMVTKVFQCEKVKTFDFPDSDVACGRYRQFTMSFIPSSVSQFGKPDGP